MKENKYLKNQIKDLSKTKEVNENILKYSISNMSTSNFKKIINELQEENTRITKQNISLYNDNLSLETKLYQTEQELTKKLSAYEAKIIQLTNNLFIQENSIKERDSIITHLKKELKKYDKDDYYISSKEIYIAQPKESNLVLNNELCEARELIVKYSHILNETKKKISAQDQKIKQLKDIIINMKRAKKIKRNIENIETFNYLLTSDSNSQSKGSSLDGAALESPIEQIPSKIKHKRYLTSYCNSNANCEIAVPKLDLSQILKKYRPVQKEESNDEENSSEKKERTSMHQIDEEYVDKLKYQNKMIKELNKRYKKKCKEQSKIISMLKLHFLKVGKRSSASTTDEKRVKDKQSNESNNIMDSSMCIEINDEEIIDFENDLNDMIKEYNQNEIHSLGETNINYANNNKTS